MRYYSTTAGEMVLQSGISSGDTSLIVDTTAGLPVTFPYTLIVDKDTASEEVVSVTAAGGTTLTITRGQDGTTAQAHSFGAKIRHGVTARDFRESREHEAATAAHGVVEVVGTTDAQTLDNKTFLPDADHSPITVRHLSGNVEPLIDVRSASDTRSAGVYSDRIDSENGGTAYLTAWLGTAINFWKTVVNVRVSSDIHGVTGTISGSPTARFLRLMSGATELFYVAASGALKAVTGAFDSHVTVGGNLSVTGTTALTGATSVAGALSGPTITALDGRLDTLEGQTLDTRLDAIEGNLGAQTTFAATSSSKNAKRLHWGAGACGTGDVGGYRTITHGAGFTPTVVVGTLDEGFRVGVDDITATTFRLRLINTDGGANIGYTGTFFYLCGE